MLTQYKALITLALLFGFAASPTSAFAQGFAPGGFDSDEDLQREMCLVSANFNLVERLDSAESSVNLCVGATTVANAVILAGCFVATSGLGAGVCISGVAASETAAVTLCRDAYASNVAEAERLFEFESRVCQMN